MSSKIDPSPQPDLLTPSEVARRLSVAVRTLWRMVARGEVPPPIRYNSRLVRWRRADIEAYVSSLPTSLSSKRSE